jgi:hypothetical protein
MQTVSGTPDLTNMDIKDVKSIFDLYAHIFYEAKQQIEAGTFKTRITLETITEGYNLLSKASLYLKDLPTKTVLVNKDLMNRSAKGLKRYHALSVEVLLDSVVFNLNKYKTHTWNVCEITYMDTGVKDWALNDKAETETFMFTLADILAGKQFYPMFQDFLRKLYDVEETEKATSYCKAIKKQGEHLLCDKCNKNFVYLTSDIRDSAMYKTPLVNTCPVCRGKIIFKKI